MLKNTIALGKDDGNKASQIDINSEHFVPFVVLWSCLKYKFLIPEDRWDPAHEDSHKAGIYAMVSEHGVTLDEALAFADAVPDPAKAAKKRALAAWWASQRPWNQ